MIFLSFNQLPIGTAKQTCDYEFTTKYAPNAFYKLKDLPGVQNNGSTHLQFYVIAQENVHIKFIVNANVETTQNFIQIGKYGI